MTQPRRSTPFSLVSTDSHFRGAALLPFLLALAFVLLLSTGCQKGQALENDGGTESSDTTRTEDGTESEDVDDLPPVEVAALDRGSIEAILRFSTNLEAESQVAVYSQAARRIVELRVEEGDTVAKGTVLVRLEDEEQRNAVARIESQLAKAQREAERQQSLWERELISEQAINEATYEVEQLDIALEDARRQLSYTEVRAPISGTITNRLINLGDTITVNQHLFDLVDFDSIVARIYVPEKELGRLRLGQTTRLFADSVGGEPREGSVIRVAPIVDPRSGTVKVTVGIPRNQGLLPGMYVEAELVTDVHADALLVPKQALVYEDNRAYLYRYLEDGTVERMTVRPLLADRDFIEPADDQLAAGDRIVIAGQAGLKNGAQVRLAAGVVRASADDAGSDGVGGDSMGGSETLGSGSESETVVAEGDAP